MCNSFCSVAGTPDASSFRTEATEEKEKIELPRSGLLEQVKWAYFENAFPPVGAQPKKAPFKRCADIKNGNH
jgi:hypothetical protein